MKKSEKLIREILCSLREAENQENHSILERLAVIEQLIKFIIDNELAHIWLFIKIILGGIISLLVGTILSLLK